MEPLAKHPRLWNRNGRYYLRARVPLDLVEIIGKAEIRICLDTANHKAAIAKLYVENVKLEAQFEEARRRRQAVPVTTLSETEIRQLAIAWLEGVMRQEAAAPLPGLSDADLADQRQRAEMELADLRAAFAQRDINEALSVADRLLKAQNVELDRQSQPYRLLCEYLTRAMIEHAQRHRERLNGLPVNGAFDALFAAVPTAPADASPAPVQETGITLGQLMDRYMEDPARANVSAKTRDSYATIFKALKQIMGEDKPVRSITRDDCRKVRDVLAALPPNAAKRFPGMTLAEAAAHAAANGIAPLSPVAANSYLNNLSALFNYAVKEEYTERNPASGLTVAAPTTPKDQRKNPFSPAQLRAIFSAPLYTGCQDDEDGYAMPGPRIVRRGRFWVPLLALWTGMRLNECCQLVTADIEERDGVAVILVRSDPEEGQRVKTKAGIRVVPVHPELKAMGFLDYVSRQRAQGHRKLFPELPVGRNGYYSDPFQKWFKRFLDKAGATAEKTSFHSFRHCFRDALREGGVMRDAVYALGGWEAKKDTADIYGSGLSAATLYREICKVRYAGLDLSDLYVDGAGDKSASTSSLLPTLGNETEAVPN